MSGSHTRGTPARYEVVIATRLAPELIARITAGEPRAHVTFAPELLPVPRYPSDRRGSAPTLSEPELARWRQITARAEVMLGFDWHEPSSMPARCPRLRFVQATFAGVGEFMVRTALDHSGIEVATAGGVFALPLAEFALMGALYFTEHVDRLNARKAARVWERRPSGTLAGRRALVVGLGGIGLESARLLGAAGLEVWGLSRRPRERPVPGVKRVIERAQLVGALAEIDVLVLACALTAETRGLIGVAELAALPARAVVVNVARGPVIDQQALISALSERRIAGACLDVFEQEPLPEQSPLWALENVIISPHSAGNVPDSDASLTELFIDNLARYLDGRPRRNVYDPAAGY